ncbi:polysaccharide deacetylase family protein, partial [bacterium]
MEHESQAGFSDRVLHLQAMRPVAALILALVLVGCARQDAVAPVSPVNNAVALYTPPEPVPPPPYDEINPKSTDRRIPVIMYHDVVAKRTPKSQWFDCSREEFEAQLKFLQEKGAVPISLRDLYEHLTQGKEVPDSAVVLTFDDNYQGFYDNALPVLRQYGYPSAMFVHTGFVGDKKGDHPKMDWKELKELHDEGLVTIGSHTISHPDDLSKLSFEDQEKELKESKRVLEEKLGGKIDFLAYPNGKFDKTTAELARIEGYTMSFTIANGLAEESPGILEVNRYVHTRLEKAWEDRDKAVEDGATFRYEAPITNSPITYESGRVGGCELRLIRGGMPTTFLSDGRQGVLDTVKSNGAQAGINGTFFAMAAIKSTDNRLVGPAKTPNMTEVAPDIETTRWPKLKNRPLVMWGPYGAAIYPYQPPTMLQDRAFREAMLDMT